MVAPVVGLQFHPEHLGTTVVLGVVAAGLYGLLAVALVLTYRVSRTIGFVHGGIALFALFLDWYLTAGAYFPGGEPAKMGRLPGMVLVIAISAALGVVYGHTVTGKLADWPRVRLTTYSLAWFVGLIAAAVTLFQKRFERVQGLPGPSPFGSARYTILGAVVTVHQLATLAILVVLTVAMGLFMFRTRTGVWVRSIADDPQAARWVGVPFRRVGMGMFGLSGAISGLAGVLMMSTIGPNLYLALFLLLRALTVTTLGGYISIPLALAGCVVLGVGEATFSAEVLGSFTTGQREIIILVALGGLVAAVNQFRPIRVLESAQ